MPSVGKLEEKLAEFVGYFSILDWKDYPDMDFIPTGPITLLVGEAYWRARKAANRANNKIQRAAAKFPTQEVHEIIPVKFGGNPVDPNNKVVLPRELHVQYSTWWKGMQGYIEEHSNFKRNK